MKKMEYTELNVWIESRGLVNLIYSISKTFPQNEIFGLVSQMNRAAVSIPSNIAEACGRNHKKETLQFLYIARGSLYELETQLYLAYDQKYIPQAKLGICINKVLECKKLLNGFINYFLNKPDNNQPTTDN